MSSYGVVTAALVEHARDLTTLADETTDAHRAAKSVSVTAGAYGRTAQDFTAVLNAAAQVGHDTLLAAAHALERAATNLRGTATDYDRLEVAEADRVTAAGGGGGVEA